MVRPTDIFRRAPGVETATFGGEQVVLDSSGRTLRGLNPTGARIWELLDGQRSVFDLAQTLAAETGAEPSAVLADVVTFLAGLLDRKLLVTP